MSQTQPEMQRNGSEAHYMPSICFHDSTLLNTKVKISNIFRLVLSKVQKFDNVQSETAVVQYMLNMNQVCFKKVLHIPHSVAQNTRFKSSSSVTLKP